MNERLKFGQRRARPNVGRMRHRANRWRALAVLIFFSPATWAADPVRAALEAGNAEYARGAYDAALEAYQGATAAISEAGPGDPSKDALRAAALQNEAAALYQLGRFADAREAWVRALPLGDAAFEAQGRYNLGNCSYQEALAAQQQGESSLEPIIEHLDRAIAQYRDALRLDRTLTNARANLELAVKLRKQLQEQSTSQPSSQPDEEQQQDQQNGNDNQNQNDNGEENSNNDADNQNGSQSDQQNGNENTNGQGQSDEQCENPQDGAGDGQQSNENGQSSDNQNANAPPEQEFAPANAVENGNENSSGQGQPEPVELSPEQAERLLQMIRDAEKARRDALRARLRAGQRPVERDW